MATVNGCPATPWAGARMKRWLSAAAGQLHASRARGWRWCLAPMSIPSPPSAALCLAGAGGAATMLVPLPGWRAAEHRGYRFLHLCGSCTGRQCIVGRLPSGTCAWLASIEALPGFVGMPRTAVGLVITVTSRGARMDRFHEMRVVPRVVAEEAGFAAAARRLKTCRLPVRRGPSPPWNSASARNCWRAPPAA